MTLIVTDRETVPHTTFPSYIDSSMLSTYKMCPRKYYYQYLRHLRPSGTGRSIHLVAGGAFAAGIETVRREVWGNNLSLQDALDIGWRKVITHWDDFDMSLTEGKSLPNVLLALEDYFIHYGTHDDHIQPMMIRDGAEKTKPAVEFSFAMPSGIPHPDTGDDLLYVGRFDMFGIREYNNQLFTYIVDEKTAGRLGPSWLQKWPLRGQFTGYAWAARDMGYNVSGCVVRGMSFLSNSFGHAESISNRSEQDIERWKASTEVFVRRLLEDYKADFFPQNFDEACGSFSGCQYSQLCLAKEPERWIPANYDVVIWNPLEQED